MSKTFLLWLATLIGSMPAYGDIIVQVQNASITSGGTGFVDVLISSTGTDNLYSAGYDFQIFGLQGNGSLIFRPSFNPLSPLDPSNQTNSEQAVNSPNAYVFLGDTDAANFYAIQDPSETRMLGGDSTLSTNNISLTSTQLLLARLEIQHVTGTPLAAIGDTFTIALVNNDNVTPVDLTDDSTLFQDNGFNPLTFAAGSDPSAFLNVGTVTITAAAVPEPGTFAVLTIAAASWCGHRFRRRKSESQSPV